MGVFTLYKLLLLTSLVLYGELRRATIADKKLFDDIFANYSNELLPGKPDEKVHIHLTVALEHLIDVNEMDQYILTTETIIIIWKDEFLKWNSTEYGGVTSMSLTPENIWRPDIVLMNVIEDDPQKRNLDLSKNRVLLSSDGQVTWFVRKTMRTSCSIHIEQFPYDTQTCPIKLSSWTYDESMLEFHITSWNSSFTSEGSVPGGFFIFDEHSFVPNNAWNIHKTTATITTDDFGYQVAIFYLTIKRKSLYFALNLILPPAILAFLTTLTFLLPAESGERMGLSITLLLSMVVFMLLIAEVTPQSSESVSIVGVFLTATFIEMVVLIINLCYVMTCYHRESYDPSVSGWKRSVVLNHLSYLIGVRQKTCNAVSDDDLVVSNNVSDVNTELEYKDDTSHFDGEDNDKRDAQLNNQHLLRFERKFDVILKKIKENEKDDVIKQEWRIVGLTLDRCMCTIFFLALLIITISCFASAPSYVH